MERKRGSFGDGGSYHAVDRNTLRMAGQYDARCDAPAIYVPQNGGMPMSCRYRRGRSRGVPSQLLILPRDGVATGRLRLLVPFLYVSPHVPGEQTTWR
jgi:hypothetical protein